MCRTSGDSTVFLRRYDGEGVLFSGVGPANAASYMRVGGPGGSLQYRGSGTAAPSSGSWAVGDRVENIAPASGGYMGWVCTSAGTPGTWKGYGLIQS